LQGWYGSVYLIYYRLTDIVIKEVYLWLGGDYMSFKRIKYRDYITLLCNGKFAGNYDNENEVEEAIKEMYETN
jgi:hypothetical protein